MRTRRAAAAACASLGLAVLAACGEDDGADPDADGTQTTSVSPSMTPPSDGPTKLTMRGLPAGSAPAIAYVAADDPADPSGPWSMTRPDGSSQAVPVTGVHSFVTNGNGAVVLVGDGDDTAAVIVDGSGQEVRREESHGYRLARTPDRSVVAWLRRDLTTTVLGASGKTLRLPKVPQAAEIGAVFGAGSCPDLSTEESRCTAYLNGEQAAEVYITSSDGLAAPLGDGIIRVSDVSATDQLIGLISVDDLGSCSGVFRDHPAPLWETCDHTLTTFSPDGSRVLGTDAYLDGFGQRSVVFLDAEGTVLREFVSRGRGATVLQTAWEDADHVLAVLYERGRWSIARLGVDGSAELALGPVVGSDLDRPFVLEQD